MKRIFSPIAGIILLILLTESIVAQAEVSTSELKLPVISSSTLLYSDTWHGSRLVEASNLLGISPSLNKLGVLDSEAVIYGANTRTLLTLVAMKPDIQNISNEEWTQWINKRISSIRQGLGPYRYDSPPTLVLQDGDKVVLDFQTTTIGTWALLYLLAQESRNTQELEKKATEFAERYQNAFGNLILREVEIASITPFLVHPYAVQLTGRGYFDHRYPTVDYVLPGDNPQMVDYLGRID